MRIKSNPKETASVVFDHGGYRVTLTQIKGLNRGRYTTAVACQAGRSKLYTHGPSIELATERIKNLINENTVVRQASIKSLKMTSK
jgi:hypothetical protein